MPPESRSARACATWSCIRAISGEMTTAVRLASSTAAIGSKAIAAAGGHHDASVASRCNAPHNRFLSGPKRVVSPVMPQGVSERTCGFQAASRFRFPGRAKPQQSS